MPMKTDNELICEFMGEEFQKEKNWHRQNWFAMPFNSSWDWLMPVVEKISTFVYEEYQTNNGYKDVTEFDCAYPRTFAMPSSNGFMVRINRMTLHESFSLIEATYQAVLEFIKWHNEQPK